MEPATTRVARVVATIKRESEWIEEGEPPWSPSSMVAKENLVVETAVCFVLSDSDQPINIFGMSSAGHDRIPDLSWPVPHFSYTHVYLVSDT